MKIFFVYSSGSYEIPLRTNNVPIMFSWINSKNDPSFDDAIPSGFPAVMIDSGGFQLQSGIRLNRELTIKHYGLWLELMLGKHPEVEAYMNLDIRGDNETTAKNQAYLESLGLHPLPVWHLGDSDELLRSYVNKYEWIALGGFVGASAGKPTIRRVFNRIKQEFGDGHKFHFLGLGISGTSVFRTFRPYSTDCSTWTSPVRFGMEIILTKEKLLKEVTTSPEDSERIRNDRVFKIEVLTRTVRLIKEFGESIENLNDPFQMSLL